MKRKKMGAAEKQRRRERREARRKARVGEREQHSQTSKRELHADKVDFGQRQLGRLIEPMSKEVDARLKKRRKDRDRRRKQIGYAS